MPLARLASLESHPGHRSDPTRAQGPDGVQSPLPGGTGRLDDRRQALRTTVLEVMREALIPSLHVPTVDITSMGDEVELPRERTRDRDCRMRRLGRQHGLDRATFERDRIRDAQADGQGVDRWSASPHRAITPGSEGDTPTLQQRPSRDESTTATPPPRSPAHAMTIRARLLPRPPAISPSSVPVSDTDGRGEDRKPVGAAGTSQLRRHGVPLLPGRPFSPAFSPRCRSAATGTDAGRIAGDGWIDQLETPSVWISSTS